jgi:hypothetical protein
MNETLHTDEVVRRSNSQAARWEQTSNVYRRIGEGLFTRWKRVGLDEWEESYELGMNLESFYEAEEAHLTEL